MKIKQITVNVYDIGDVLDVSELRGTSGKETLTKAKRAVVISKDELKDERVSYWVLTDRADKVRITAEQMRGEKYIGNIDMNLLFTE